MGPGRVRLVGGDRLIQIDVWGMLCIMGVPTAATGLFVWLLQRWISKKEKKREEIEGKREKLQLQLVRSVNASIALSEATAKAVQRIPDAHCNGDMHDALDFAERIKQEQREFLTEQGVHALV